MRIDTRFFIPFAKEESGVSFEDRCRIGLYHHRLNIQDECHDGIASRTTADECTFVCALCRQQCITESVFGTFAHCPIDSGIFDRPYIDIYRVYAIVSVRCLTVESIGTRRSDIIIGMPSVWRSIRADINGIILDVICLVYTQAEAIDTITTIGCSKAVDIFAGSVQDIRINEIASLDVLPVIGQFCIGNIYLLMSPIFRIYIQS